MPPLAQIFVPPLLALRVPNQRWKRLFEAYAAPLPFADDAKARERTRPLFGFRGSPELERAIDTLALFGSPLGESALREAAADIGFELPLQWGWESVAAWVVAKLPKGGRFRKLEERTMLGIGRYAPNDFSFERAISSGRAPESMDATIQALHARYREHGGEILHVRGDDDRVHLAVVRADRPRGFVAVKRGTLVRTTRRLVVAEEYTFDFENRLLIAKGDDPLEHRDVLKLFGRTLYGDASAISTTPTCTLKPLGVLGAQGLAAVRLPDGVRRVRTVECEGDDGDGASHWEKGSNALDAYERRGGTTSGYLNGSMLRIDLANERFPLDVAIRLPHRVSIRPARHAGVARAVMKAIGILSPGVHADDSWSLAPWLHPGWRLRRVVGDAAFERMKEQGLLVRVETRMVGLEQTRHYGWSYIAFPLEGEPTKRYAVADDPALPSFTIDAKDVTMWRLDTKALAKVLRDELQLKPSADPAVAPFASEALELGVLDTPKGAIHFFALLRSPGRDPKPLLVALRRSAKLGQAVLLLPEGRTTNGALLEVPLTAAELFGAEPSRGKIMAALENELGHGALVEPWKLAAKGVRLVISERTSEAWFDGVALELGDKAVALLLALAKARGKVVPTKELEATIWTQYTSGILRKTVERLSRQIRKNVVAAGRELAEGEEFVVEAMPGRGWRISASFEVR